jgi:S1-C subfamily serine protease
MKRQLCSLLLTTSALITLVSPCVAKNTSEFKQNDRTISLELEFSRKNTSALQRVMSFLNGGPNAYATGFLVGGRLVLTAYHVISGNLDETKKVALGFGKRDTLNVKVSTNGCEAKVLKVDPDADLALLEVCNAPKDAAFLAWASSWKARANRYGPSRSGTLASVSRWSDSRAAVSIVF